MVFTIYIHTSIYYILIPIWKWRYVPVGMFVLIWVWKSKLLIYLSRFPLSLSSLYTTATVNKYDCENSWCCYNLVVMRWTSLNPNLFLFQNRSSSNIENKAGKKFFFKIESKPKVGIQIRVQTEFESVIWVQFWVKKPNPNNIFWVWSITTT